ncbi:MAG: type I-F CRISPR-associated protein Csy1 [Xanthomonadaceae bacterium]|nr:type I-F CRISPR-associated protein Csy1 [Xanthomonadaceae bacterium]
MTEPSSPTPSDFRGAIEAFLTHRLDGKLKELSPDDPKRELLIAQFRTATWIADAARRVVQLQLVTHTIKPTHPDARGSNLYRPPETLAARSEAGSHSIGPKTDDDVVGNAAALDVHKFLKIDVAGAPLLHWLREGNSELIAALDPDPAQAEAWRAAFIAIEQPRDEALVSHSRAKQIYWLVGDDPVDDDHYHLLAPLYASPLAHAVFATVNEHRYSEAAKLALKARREKQAHDGVSRDYPDLVEQKLGGSKPQNISQLNSERGGKNYLLASLPPRWKSREVRAPWRVESVFPLFGKGEEVRALVRGLRKFLESNPERTMETRDLRDDYTDALIGELLRFATTLQEGIAPGWSLDPRCRLVEEESLWLDPGRAANDENFGALYLRMDWPDVIARRFGNWLNGRLVGRLPVGDNEHRHWSRELTEHLQWATQVDEVRQAIKHRQAGARP